MPLRILLIVPFVLQTVGVVTLVGYLSYRSSQETVKKLADQLITEVGDRIDQHLDSYLGKAQKINRTNVDAFESGILDFNDFNALGKYFYRQVRFFNFTYVNFGSKEGGFIGAGYGLGNKKIDIAEIPKSDPTKFRFYSVDNQGNRLSLVATLKNPQYSNFAWYSEALKAGKPVWSSIYTWGGLPHRISISASTPVYDSKKQLLGVLGIDLELSQISQFLKTLHGSRSGHIFIIERSGLIVASSEDESPAPIINGQATRLQALNSREPVIREVTEDLIQRFGSLQAISQSQSFRPALKQKPFVRVMPYRDSYGLDWLVVTVIPESEFIGEIYTNAHRTILLCGLALIIAIATGSLTAYWIARPILQLSQVSQAMAKGEWQDSLSEDIAIAELKVLATSFNQMSAQIKKSFQESENKFAIIFQTTPNPVWIATLAEGKFLNVNESFCQFFGDISEKIVGKTCTELQLWENIEDRDYLKQTLINEGNILNFKVVIRTAYKKNKTVLMSARVQFLGEEDCLIGVMKDVTDLYAELRLRKQTEEALQKSEAMLLEAQRVAHIGNWEYEVTTGKITWSTNLFQILGRDRTLGEPTYQENLRLYHPEDAELLHQTVQRSLATGESYQLELRVVNPNGSYRYIEGRGRTEINAQGQVVRLFGTVQNITQRKQAEEKLRKNQHFIEKITYLTPNLLYIYDLIEQRNVYINRYVEEILGYSAQAIQEMGANLFATICHPDDLNYIYENILKCYNLQDYEFIEIEYRVRDAQGKWRWLYTRDTVFSRTAEGNVKQILGTSQDITDRKQVEVELRKSRDLREAIYNESTDAIFLVDVPNPLILDCNRRAVEMFEVESKEKLIGIKGQSWQKQQFTEDEKSMIVEEVAKLGFWSQEIEYVTQTGRNFWGNMAVKRINIASKVIDLVRVTDISKRKKAELALRQSEKRLQEISASSPGVIYIIVKRLDDSLYYEYVSHAFEDIHEITVEQVLENPQLCFQQFHPDDYPGYMEAAIHSLETMSPFNYEWRIITPSGKLKWVKARSRPELRENGDIAFYGVVLDVSDRKEAELALQEAEANLRRANQELEQLVNIDGLTQIANRRCFDHRLEQEWQRLYREQQPLSLLLFDVDYFKRYNDYYGHQLGDECLIIIAQAIQQVVFRPADLVARYGGEEFVAILPDTDIEGAIAVAQKIHAAIQALAIPHQTSEVSDIVTISLGITTITPTSELSLATIIDQADQALYRAKQQGRNQSVIFSFEEG
ncbi:diguanylate cyclase domain-containing protein [Sphaerospermopsis aphanizomenoides]|uniref:diguanylate cyclase domain-containing protein n=1 Tax=Sphaerospermopsis aphanizomenoides TaxID=459663 RepID=UPI0019035FEB